MGAHKVLDFLGIQRFFKLSMFFNCYASIVPQSLVPVKVGQAA